LRDLDHKKLAAITSAVTAFIEAEQAETALAEPPAAQDAWALSGRLDQMLKGTLMQQRPAAARCWSAWAL